LIDMLKRRLCQKQVARSDAILRTSLDVVLIKVGAK